MTTATNPFQQIIAALTDDWLDAKQISQRAGIGVQRTSSILVTIGSGAIEQAIRAKGHKVGQKYVYRRKL